MLLLEPVRPSAIDPKSSPPYSPASVPSVASESGLPERTYAVEKHGKVLAGDNKALGVYRDRRSFDFPAIDFPKKENPKKGRGGFRGRRGPKPVGPVPAAHIHSVTLFSLDKLLRTMHLELL